MSVQFLYLTTTGRTSGLAREIEIWFVEADGKYYILAEFPHSHWMQNIAKNPRVHVRVGDLKFEATARALDPNSDEVAFEMAQRLEREKYGWGDGLPVEITPISSTTATPAPTRRPAREG
jgi:deazaflavin-dependent oxidoreductase (nitroreductase family)